MLGTTLLLLSRNNPIVLSFLVLVFLDIFHFFAHLIPVTPHLDVTIMDDEICLSSFNLLFC